jgi:TPR repeat protein
MEGGESCYNLAMLYLEGVGVEKNYVTAMRYMSDAADMGCVEAQLYLGMAYTMGYVLYPDITGICMIPYHKPEYRQEFFELDGDIGDIEAFERDEDLRYSAVKQDGRAAFEWFKMAARHDPTYVEQLSAKGKYLYARCYVDGLGTDYDREKSIRLMALAGKAGSEEAVTYFMENGITSEMIADAVNPKKLSGGRR